jgi:predicted DNA-binding transcriptional regulator YafY
MIDRLHEAIARHHVLRLDYCDEAGRESRRDVEPLCLAFWGGVWTLGSWCRLRCDFRNFRPDRIRALEPAGEVFEETAEHGFEGYLRAMGARAEALDD